MDAQRAWVQFSKAVEPVPSRRAYFRFARAVECANLRARNRKRSLSCLPPGPRQEAIREMRRRYTASNVRRRHNAYVSKPPLPKSAPQKSSFDDEGTLETSPNDENKPDSPTSGRGDLTCQSSEQLLSLSGGEPWISWTEIVYIGAPAFVLGLALIGVTIIAVVDY